MQAFPLTIYNDVSQFTKMIKTNKHTNKTEEQIIPNPEECFFHSKLMILDNMKISLTIHHINHMFSNVHLPSRAYIKKPIYLMLFDKRRAYILYRIYIIIAKHTFCELIHNIITV